MGQIKLEIGGERVKLRKLKLSDAQKIYENLQDKDVVKWTLNIPWPYKKQDAEKWIRKSHYKIRNKKEYVFGIVLKDSDELVGAISLMHIDWANKNAEIGYWLGKKYWGRGFMTEATKLTLRFAFEKLGLHRVYAHLFEENIGSKRVLEKCGFKLEGILRDHTYKHNMWHNRLVFGILSQEFGRA